MTAARRSTPEGGDPIRDPAQQNWLAGLGALAKAQQEGAKVFEALVQEGQRAQKQTQTLAEETLAQAQSRLAGVASGLGERAAAPRGKLEGLFEERVARALERLGTPTLAQLTALQARVKALEAALAERPPASAIPRATPRRATPQPPADPQARKTPARRSDGD